MSRWMNVLPQRATGSSKRWVDAGRPPDAPFGQPSKSHRPTLSCDSVGSLAWQRDDAKPEILDRLHDGHKLVQVNRLADVAVCVPIIALQNVPLGVRSRQHNHGNPTK